MVMKFRYDDSELKGMILSQKNDIENLLDDVWRLKNPFTYSVGQKVSFDPEPRYICSPEPYFIGVITKAEYQKSHNKYDYDRFSIRYDIYVDQRKHTYSVYQSQIVKNKKTC